MTLGSYLEYVGNLEETQRAISRIKKAHLPDCSFNFATFPQISPLTLSEGVISRKTLYLYAREIYEACLQSLEGTEISFNQELVRARLLKFVPTLGEQNLLALCGWRIH